MYYDEEAREGRKEEEKPSAQWDLNPQLYDREATALPLGRFSLILLPN